MKTAVVNKNTIADHEIVAAVAGQKIRVLHYILAAAGTVVVTWKSATNAISGPMSMAIATNLECHAPDVLDNQGFLLETNPGENLTLALSAAIQVSGHLVYQYVSP